MKHTKRGNMLARITRLLRKKKRNTKKAANNSTFIATVFHAKYGCVEYSAIKDAIIMLNLDRYNLMAIRLYYNLASATLRSNTPFTS